MRFQIPSALGLLAALGATPALAGQKVVALWAVGTWSVAGGTGGNVNSWDSIFALLNEDGESIFQANLIDGYKSCIHVGQDFQLGGACFGGAWYGFQCSGNQIGNPEDCEVFGPDGESLAKGSSDDATDYFGLGISESGNCKVQFELAEGIECWPNSIGFETHVVDS
jgi:hypothetical protein